MIARRTRRIHSRSIAPNTLFGVYVETQAQTEENLRLETDKRKDILSIERALADIDKSAREEELQHKKRFHKIKEEKAHKLMDIPLHPRFRN